MFLKNYYLISILIAVFMLSSFVEKTPWVKGKIVTKEGKEITGEVFYDIEADVIKLRGEDKEFVVFSPHSIERFEYFDKNEEPRSYISLPYKEGEAFYEIFLETPFVALLIKRDYVWSQEIQSNGMVDKIKKETEEVFIVDSQGLLHPYMVNYKNRFGIQTGWRFQNKDLISEITRDKLPLVREFAKEKNLDFNRMKDLIEILNYYSQLKENH